MTSHPVPWLLFDSGPGEPALNMAIDEAMLLEAADLGKPVLRFYAWTVPAATFGYFQKYADIASWTLLRPLIRRPTGGGLVPHIADWTYSVVIPPHDPWYEISAEASYRRVHEWIREAFIVLNVETELAREKRHEIPGQCFIGAEKQDLLWHGRKIAGAAQRRNRHGLLIQGSVQQLPGSLVREEWQRAMRDTAVRNWDVHWSPLDPRLRIMPLARRLSADEYSQAAYHEKK